MGVFKLNILVIISVCSNLISESEMLSKEAYLSVPKLISLNGYPVEKHRANTPDGYTLQMHRIPAGRRSARRTGEPSAKGKKAVLVMHGLLGSSGDFVIMGPDRSLAYILADAGYDVWLGNLRGNRYSAHETWNKKDKRFWEYSFHEHGKYDIPSMIDQVLNVTGLKKIMYVGYSMGTTSFFTMMAQRPEYNQKIISFVALAPAVYLDNIRPLAKFLLETMDMPRTLERRGFISANFGEGLMDFLLKNVCNMNNPHEDMCLMTLYSIVGDDYEQNDNSMTSVIFTRVQPASWRQLEHFGKIAIAGVFTSWNGGLSSPVKPYKLSNVKVPVALLYGENDQLIERSQIMRLAKELKQAGVLEEVRLSCDWPKFNHLDFVFAKDVGNLLNRPLVKYIDQLYNKYGDK
ncbi:hypothetical protein K1T71_011630 [Dendrolimus kikuchii]|uniref:Uncharacterized protein n=1 Tax=Dendrolimus kikuchii TaxID=765133 RepID=A0ACC1CM19_9NEOP|nr:hypothetical protein K1T71_011630 [Dendrolimus kikuchii]